jgi:uncharacterized protein (DUF488 family)
MVLYTIGHSNHPVDKFILLLEDNGISRLVDVRSKPYSRFNPQFNKNPLQQSLAKRGIEYIYMGDALGCRPSDPTCYVHSKIPDKPSDYLHEVDYREVMQRPWFIEGICQLLELLKPQTTCILCSEKNPEICHRHHLIARYLMENYQDLTIWHILADGSLVNATSIASMGDQPGSGQQALDL